MADLSLKQPMTRLHDICVPHTRWVGELGGGGHHFYGVLPRVVEFGEKFGAGLPDNSM